MTLPVLINNHIYGRFLERAVASVLHQTRPLRKSSLGTAATPVIHRR
jgi:hypothetical protein